MKRNEAIAGIMNFKKYNPSVEVKENHERAHGRLPMQWYYLPNVGRYNSFELKFHNDYNWLISACIELKKYEHSHVHGTKLDGLFQKIMSIRLININHHQLWTLVSDYAITLLQQKQTEANGTNSQSRS